jgi:predicted ATPase/class 3 adenylate cyclase
MLASGTITFLFTDIEGSTQLWDKYPQEMRLALDQHNTLLHKVMAAHDGIVFKIVGDSFQVAFTNPAHAVQASIDVQRKLKSTDWPKAIGEIRVRIGIHTGEAHPDGSGDYAANHTLNKVARISSAGHGGQILISLVSAKLAREALDSAVQMRDMGEHYLKGLSHPEHLYQIDAPDLLHSFPHLNTLSQPNHNRPPQRTTFIGREKEISQIKKLLGISRLVTLTGIGGSGKTRLALKVGEELQGEYRDGVWLVELANIREPALVLQSIASVLNITKITEATLDEVLKRYLSQKQLLLLIDNLEHLLECAPLIGELLAVAPHLSIICTSRERLHIYGEQEYPVRPLNLPESIDNSSITKLKNVESIVLFLQRAQAVDPTISFTDEALEDLARICLRLDGLPLAIELCAPMVKVFPLGVIADQIENNLDAIPKGPRDLHARQQTLRSTIQWSFDLLEENEKRLFVHMAIFYGGGTLQAVEAICGDRISDDIRNNLSALVNKNLVLPQERQDGEIHFGLLETIRQYGREKLLASEEAEQLAGRHTEYFIEIAKQGSAELRGTDQVIWTDRFITRQHNFRAALERLIEDGEVDAALNFANDLFEFWLRHSDFQEGQWWLTRVMAMPNAQQHQEQYTSALINLAWITWWLASKDAKPLAEQAILLARAQGSESNIAKALATLGIISANQRNLTEARNCLEESRDIYLDIQDGWGYARTLMGLAVVQKFQNHYDAASSLYTQSFNEYKKLGDIHFQCVVKRLIGDLEVIRNNLAEGVEAYRESLVIARIVKSNLQIAHNFWGLARVAKVKGNHARALRLYLVSKKIYEDIGAWMSEDEPELEETLATARAALGKAEFQSAREAGQNMTIEEAIELALANTSIP